MMEPGAILLLLAVLLVVILFVARPFAAQARAESHQDQEMSAALAERERLLTALQELDFDYKLGKIPAEEYPAQRALLVEKGAAVLRRLDELKAAQMAAAADSIETSLAARRLATASRPSALSDEEVEDLIARRRAARHDRTAGFCPKCGKAVLQSDQFCSSCGKALK
jgi:hypothetical protein